MGDTNKIMDNTLGIDYFIKTQINNHLEELKVDASNLTQIEHEEKLEVTNPEFTRLIDSLYLEHKDDFDVQTIEVALRNGIVEYLVRKNLVAKYNSIQSLGDFVEDVKDYYLEQIAKITDDLQLLIATGQYEEYDPDDEPWDELS